MTRPENGLEIGQRWVDELLGGRIKVWRTPDVYPPAIDALLLAATVDLAPGRTILDVGIGSGAASLALFAREPACYVCGIDLNEPALSLAAASAQLNGFGDNLRVIHGDLATASKALKSRQFDVVITNPPFYEPASVRGSPKPARSGAHEESMPLEVWLDLCLKRVRSRGWLHIIHRGDRIAGILAGLAPQLGDLRILPIFARAGSEAAVRVIIAGRKASRAPARLLQGLVLHNADDSFTEAAEQIVKHARPLHLTGKG